MAVQFDEVAEEGPMNGLCTSPHFTGPVQIKIAAAGPDQRRRDTEDLPNLTWGEPALLMNDDPR
jgi:hypothetical protein